MEDLQKLKKLLVDLCSAAGPSGAEEGAADVALAALAPYAQAEVDAMGNVRAHLGRKGAARHILLDAHNDQIGLIVTGIDGDGFLNIAQVGGVDRRILPGCPVTVLGRERLTGIVCCVPPHLSDGGDKLQEIKDMHVDVGLPKDEAERLVRPGDRILLHYEPVELLNGRVSSGALDNRSGVAALIRCAQLLHGEPLDCEVTLLLSSREEVNAAGAQTGTFAENPDEAIVVDVDFAVQPGLEGRVSGRLGGGPMIGCTPGVNRRMTSRLVALAKKLDMPYSVEVAGSDSGTNCAVVIPSRAGVQTALVSIPLRYMHTAIEVVDVADVEKAARLLAEYIKGVRENG